MFRDRHVLLVPFVLALAPVAHAVEIDGDYADAIYNLGALEYEAGALAEAVHWWRRYLELDADSEWAKRARHGIALIERQARRFVAGRARKAPQ